MANEVVSARQTITADLYALRAGLSVVSGEVQQGQNAFDKAKARLESEKKDADLAVEGAKMVVDHWKDAKNRLDYGYWKPIVKISISSVLLIMCVGLLAFSAAFWLSAAGIIYGEATAPLSAWIERLGNDFSTPGLLMPIAALVGIIIFARLLHNAVRHKNYFAEEYDHDVKPSLVDETELFVDGIELLVDETDPRSKKIKLEDMPHSTSVKVNPAYIERKISEAEANLENIRRQGQRNIAAAEVEYKSAIATAIAEHIMPAKTMYSTLVEFFSLVLDERDWANLDYLIYAVETRRADTIKEALQLLDREKQTDRIVAAIQAASREIAQLLVTGFTALSNQISSGIAMLSQQIQANSYQTAQLSARMSQIANAQTLNNALLEKANESSEQLVADAHRIVELENMRYNRGY